MLSKSTTCRVQTLECVAKFLVSASYSSFTVPMRRWGQGKHLGVQSRPWRRSKKDWFSHPQIHLGSGDNHLIKDRSTYSELTHFFLPPFSPSSFFSQLTTLPNMTTPLPSMKATRGRPSQFLKESHTNGCCGWKQHSAISLNFKECGSSIFFPPVSLPIFHTSFEMRHADRPQRTKPIGE